MAVRLVKVRDTITYERTSILLIEVGDADDPETVARDRCIEGSVVWDEDQIDNTPYEATELDDAESERLAELLLAARDRPGPLDHDELKEMNGLLARSGIPDQEVFWFNERRKTKRRKIK